MANYGNQYNKGNSGFAPKGNYNQAKPKAKSGAKMGMDKNGKPYVNGWFIQNKNLISLFAFPHKESKEIKTKTGQLWETWVLKIQNKGTLTESIRPCLYQPSTGRVFCQELDIMLSPKTKRRDTVGQGYAGSYLKNH